MPRALIGSLSTRSILPLTRTPGSSSKRNGTSSFRGTKVTDRGLKEVPNPSAIFLSGQEQPTSGSAIMVTREGTRPLLVEVQALVDQSPLANPRRVALGLEQNRLAMLLAVLHRHGDVAVFDQDVFVNVVGGIRLQETAADLPILLAVLSSFRDRPLGRKLVSFGEVGLSGEIRPVPNAASAL